MINFIQICPLELFEQIIEDDKLALSRLSCVHPLFSALTEAYVKKYPIKEYFGKDDWKKYGVSLSQVPKIPLKFYQLFDPSKHILTFIPKEIGKKKPLTLKTFDKYALKILESQYNKNFYEDSLSTKIFVNTFWLITYHELPQSGKHSIFRNNFKKPQIKKHKSHWVLLSKNTLKGTEKGQTLRFKFQDFEIQNGLIKAPDQEIPKLVDAVVSIVMHYFKTGEECFYRFLTRVQEKDHDGLDFFVGEFSEGFITVNTIYGYDT